MEPRHTASFTNEMQQYEIHYGYQVKKLFDLEEPKRMNVYMSLERVFACLLLHATRLRMHFPPVFQKTLDVKNRRNAV